jgi:hypothetical protein
MKSCAEIVEIWAPFLHRSSFNLALIYVQPLIRLMRRIVLNLFS